MPIHGTATEILTVGKKPVRSEIFITLDNWQLTTPFDGIDWQWKQWSAHWDRAKYRYIESNSVEVIPLRSSVEVNEDSGFFSENRKPGSAVRNVITEEPCSASSQFLLPKRSSEIFGSPDIMLQYIISNVHNLPVLRIFKFGKKVTWALRRYGDF